MRVFLTKFIHTRCCFTFYLSLKFLPAGRVGTILYCLYDRLNDIYYYLIVSTPWRNRFPILVYWPTIYRQRAFHSRGPIFLQPIVSGPIYLFVPLGVLRCWRRLLLRAWPRKSDREWAQLPSLVPRPLGASSVYDIQRRLGVFACLFLRTACEVCTSRLSSYCLFWSLYFCI